MPQANKTQKTGSSQDEAVDFDSWVHFTQRQREAEVVALDHRHTLYGGAAGGGKLLALDTLVPTVTGWTTMGEVKVGDELLGRDGRACRVNWVSDVQEGEACHRLLFDDGATVVAGASHEWVVYSRADRAASAKRTDEHRATRRVKRPLRGTGQKPWLATKNRERAYVLKAPPNGRVVTTAEIARSVKARGRCEWSVPLVAPCEGLETALPIAPYVLGAWLGDGTGANGSITNLDGAVIDGIRACGYKVSRYASLKTWNIVGLIGQLRRAGLRGNKHIPQAYLRASLADREALLRGLLDTDGHIAEDGRIEFTTVRRQLADDVLELALSLGVKATKREGRAALNGRDCGPKWRVCWMPRTQTPCFTVAAKAARQKPPRPHSEARWRYIVACEETEPVPLRCLAVDSPDHTFLVTRSFIPTHNSYWLRWATIRDLMRFWARYQIPGIHAGLFCETYTALRDRHLGRLRVEVPRWLGSYNATEHEVRLAPEYGSGVLCLRNLDDPGRYLSAEWAVMAIDELTRNTEDVYDMLLTRLRWPGLPPEEWRIRSGSNPGSVGHAWVKRRWITRDFLPHERPEDYAFVPAKVADNPYLPKDYALQLAGLPPYLRRAYLDGDWDIFAGQAFPEWRRTVHVIDPFEMPRQWLRVRAVDYGYSAPSAVLWVAVSSDGLCYVYRELYRAGLGPAELAQAVVALTPAEEEVRYTVADPSLFARNAQTGASNADVMARNGVPCIPGTHDRVSGWRMVHEYLRVYDDMDGGQLTPAAKMRFFSNCTQTIRTLPEAVYDPHRLEDVDANCEAHALDALRYFCMSRPAFRFGEQSDKKAALSREERWKQFYETDTPTTTRSAGW